MCCVCVCECVHVPMCVNGKICDHVALGHAWVPTRIITVWAKANAGVCIHFMYLKPDQLIIVLCKLCTHLQAIFHRHEHTHTHVHENPYTEYCSVDTAGGMEKGYA